MVRLTQLRGLQLLLLLQATRKVWVVRFVSRRIWLELAAWSTARSALKGWKVERRIGGVRFITPIIGWSVILAIGESK